MMELDRVRWRGFTLFCAAWIGIALGALLVSFSARAQETAYFPVEGYWADFSTFPAGCTVGTGATAVVTDGVLRVTRISNVDFYVRCDFVSVPGRSYIATTRLQAYMSSIAYRVGNDGCNSLTRSTGGTVGSDWAIVWTATGAVGSICYYGNVNGGDGWISNPGLLELREVVAPETPGDAIATVASVGAVTASVAAVGADMEIARDWLAALAIGAAGLAGFGMAYKLI